MLRHFLRDRKVLHRPSPPTAPVEPVPNLELPVLPLVLRGPQVAVLGCEACPVHKHALLPQTAIRQSLLSDGRHVPFLGPRAPLASRRVRRTTERFSPTTHDSTPR